MTQFDRPSRRRALFRLVALAAAERVALAGQQPRLAPQAHKVVLVTIGGIRLRESFSPEGLVNIPRLSGDMAPRALFFPHVRNEGVTSHFNTIASILSGTWQHVDDWGREPPSQPTLFNYYQQQLAAAPSETWVVTSNKALTSNIGVGANVILCKQLLIEAVERIVLGYSARQKLHRELLLEELTAVMQDDYERVGWRLPSASSIHDPEVKKTLLTALANFINGPDSPTSGDELTCMVAMEVLRRISPSLMMMNFSDMEAAHNGTYSLHLAGIRRSDALALRLWEFIESLPQYAGRTTFVVMPEFGRDPDGSTSNGFFNHRSNTDTNRLVWMMVLGEAVRQPGVVEREIRQIDVAPTLATWLRVECRRATGSVIPEFAV
jgi:hypothetical protein